MTSELTVLQKVPEVRFDLHRDDTAGEMEYSEEDSQDESGIEQEPDEEDEAAYPTPSSTDPGTASGRSCDRPSLYLNSYAVQSHR